MFYTEITEVAGTMYNYLLLLICSVGNVIHEIIVPSEIQWKFIHLYVTGFRKTLHKGSARDLHKTRF